MTVRAACSDVFNSVRAVHGHGPDVVSLQVGKPALPIERRLPVAQLATTRRRSQDVSGAELTSWRARCPDLNFVTLRLGVWDVAQATW